MFILAMILSVVMGMTMSMLGGGGSILTVPILVYVLEVETKSAIATSLLVVISIGAFSTFMHARAGNVQWTTGLIFGAVAMVGAYGGGLLAEYISGPALLILFTGMMGVTAVAMLRKGKGKPDPDAGAKHPPLIRYSLIVLEGLGVGLATGLVGAGGGFLVVPVLVLLGGLDMHRAVGTALLVIVMKSAASFAGYVTHETIDYRLAGYVIAMALIGAAAGSVLARRLAHDVLRKSFAWFVLLMACFILYRELTLDMLRPVIQAPWEYWAIGIAGCSIAIVLARFMRSPASASESFPLSPVEQERDSAKSPPDSPG